MRLYLSMLSGIVFGSLFKSFCISSLSFSHSFYLFLFFSSASLKRARCFYNSNSASFYLTSSSLAFSVSAVSLILSKFAQSSELRLSI